MRAWCIVSLLGLAGVSAGFIACSTSEACDFGECTAPGVDAGKDVPVIPQDCNLAVDPKDSKECIADSVGIFVSPTGRDDAPGTRERPVQTIKVGLSKATDGPRARVYVCEGEYKEAVAITSAVSVYGGFACAGWTVGGGATKILPEVGAAEGAPTALTVTKVGAKITIADLSFASPNAPAARAGASSIAGFVSESQEVTFKRVSFTAGTGTAADSTTPAKHPDWPPTAPPGVGSDGGAPGGEAPNTCAGLVAPNDRSVGAAGGAKGEDGGTGTPVIAADPSARFTGVGGLTDNGGGCGGSGVGGTGAHDGAYGAAGTQGPVVGGVGKLGPSGYLPANGAAGGNGGTAQGGGGGAGNPGAGGGHGGGGGAGGCGGKGGAGGQAGGSSIALLVYRTKVHLLEGTALHVAAGGKGGPGGPGQKAQAGGNLGTPASGGCGGAQGGHGGSGAGGTGGAGGASIGLGYLGDAPSIDGADVAEAAARQGWTLPGSAPAGGAKGDKGPAAVGGSHEGQDGNPGPAGVVKAVAALPAVP